MFKSSWNSKNFGFSSTVAVSDLKYKISNILIGQVSYLVLYNPIRAQRVYPAPVLVQLPILGYNSTNTVARNI